MCACRLKPVVRVVSLDITGTLVRFSSDIGSIYHQSALRAALPNPPSPAELDVAFRSAFKEALRAAPCYGYHSNGMSERQWWVEVVENTLCKTGREYSTSAVQLFSRRALQAFGSSSAFTVFEDTLPLLSILKERGICAGVLTNSPQRTVEDTLPLLGLDAHLDWFVSCRDIGIEKPDKRLFDHAFSTLQRKLPSLRRDEIIHVGDNYELDYLGARNAGFQALLLGAFPSFSLSFSSLG